MEARIDMNVKMGPKCYAGIVDLERGVKIDEQEIHALCDFVDARYDCADFRMVSLLRTRFDYWCLIGEDTKKRIEHSILNFKYWMDEQGHDGMCYWSENHQILFATCEYLAGQLYPQLIFPNNNMSGLAHYHKAKTKIERWLKYRFDYGFTEWHSNTYYEEDIAPLTLLIDFSDDVEIRRKATIIMDLILLDMAIHSYKGLFVASSGRCYELQKKYPLKQDTLEIAEAIWGYGNVSTYDYSRISANFLLMRNYKVPEVIKAIGRDSSTVEIKDSMGLDLSEIKNEFKNLRDFETTGMFLWAMESFTNPESINITLDLFNAWHLKYNNFLKDISMVNIPILRKSGIMPLVVKLLNPVTQGVAIQRANVYTYKTPDYMLSTAQRYHPGKFGDQQHIWQLTLNKDVTVFVTHPGSPAFDDVDRNFSPDYWVGNGIFPHSVQSEHVHISLFDLTGRKGFMERNRLMQTHAYFPQHLFEQVILDNNMIFASLEGVHVSLIGRSKLKFSEKDKSDLIQEGKKHYWICEIGTKDQFTNLTAFVRHIKSTKIQYDERKLTYQSVKHYEVTYKGDFKVNSQIVETQYKRYETPYIEANRKPSALEIKFNSQSLFLNFEKGERQQDDKK